jgi:opacity protein-like surface antigen
MYKLVAVIAVLVLLLVPSAVAQDNPKGEVFLGYSYMHADTGDSGLASSIPAGMNVDAAFYPTTHFGLVADFQWHHKSFDNVSGVALVPAVDVRLISMHFGPRVKMRSGKLEPFAHALFGFTNGNVSQGTDSGSDNAFSMKLGGGLDVVASRHVAIRLGEFNYYFSKFSINEFVVPVAEARASRQVSAAIVTPTTSDHQNNFTFSTGLVLRF